MMRKDGQRKGKLLPKAEGLDMVAEITDLDDSKNIAVIEDTQGARWTKHVADLSLWE